MTNSVLLSGCASLPAYPDHKVYSLNIGDDICSQFRIVDKRKGKFAWEKDLPLRECDGFFAIHYRDLPRVKAWIFDVIRILENRNMTESEFSDPAFEAQFGTFVTPIEGNLNEKHRTENDRLP